MASYRPSAELRIAKPCDQRWEDMPGDSRVRHCNVCEKDVVNTAAMTPKQIEAMLQKPLPCLRIVRDENGALLVASESSQSRWGKLAALAASALVTISGLATTAQQRPNSRTLVLGRVPTVTAELHGKVLDQTGAAIAGSLITLTSKEGTSYEVKADANGVFTTHLAIGGYKLSVSSPGFETAHIDGVLLHQGTQDLGKPITLFVGAVGGPIAVDTETLTVPTESVSSSTLLEKQ